MKRQKNGMLVYLLAIAFVLGGCSGRTGSLEQAYSFEQSQVLLAESPENHSRTAAFASDLCVVDETPKNTSGVTSGAAAVFDLNNSEVIVSKNIYERLNPASTTKILTALLAVKYGNLSDIVEVTEDAVITEAGATLCQIHPGDRLTLEQLLYGLMVPSGNDAGAAIAVHMAGSIDDFSDMMNEEARRIGATGTHFVNPHGLTSSDHYTTAYDLYLFFNEALKYPVFREIIGTTSYTTSYEDKDKKTVTQTWKVGNWYMTGDRDMPRGMTMLGGKTGTTSAAGYCLVMASRDSENREYISVVLKAENRSGLYDNMTNIIEKIQK